MRAEIFRRDLLALFLSLSFFCGKEGILFLWEESKGNCEFVTGGERAGGALFGITRVTLSGSVEEEYDEFLDELKVRG